LHFWARDGLVSASNAKIIATKAIEVTVNFQISKNKIKTIRL
jgi:hypothetical protein